MRNRMNTLMNDSELGSKDVYVNTLLIRLARIICRNEHKNGPIQTDNHNVQNRTKDYTNQSLYGGHIQTIFKLNKSYRTAETDQYFQVTGQTERLDVISRQRERQHENCAHDPDIEQITLIPRF